MEKTQKTEHGTLFVARFIAVALVAGLVGFLPAAALAQRGGGNSEPAPPAPRLPDGTIDLGGDGVWDLPYITNMATPERGVDEVPFLPWSRAMWEYNRSNDVKYDPEGFCLPPGGPRAFATPYPAQIIQQSNPARIVIIFEGGGHVWRQIYMDGREHPQGDELNPTYFGHSVGHWEGDTLVIDTVGYNEKTWIDYNGHVHTEKLHTIERITRTDLLTMRYEATFDDPGAYSEPWTSSWNINFRPGWELQEYICQENNKYLLDLKDDFGEPFFQGTPESD